tara:strand:+ start:214 stop:1995 length:1782 start_codon:yes stop_codon:yes gene_type:complete
MSETKRFDFTIGMAAFENFDEVYFTIQALRFYHPEAIERFEIIVVDNSPGTREGEAVRKLIEGRVKDRGRYVPFPKPKGSCPPRGHLFDVATGKFVVCIDSHVLLDVGALDYLVRYFDANPDSDDLLQGPLVSNYGPHRIEGTHMFPEWRSHMFGTWRVDERGKDPDGEPFEIPEHGLGLFAARRESWLGFHPDLVGFSGGEGYIHEKYRQAGRRCLCLPGARWYHKFSRPNGIPHRPSVEDKIRNHVRGWTELGVDLATGRTDEPVRSMCEHYVIGRGTSDGRGIISFERFKSLCREVGHEYKGEKPIPPIRGLVVGPKSFGSFRMRGRPITEALGWKELNSRSRITMKDGEEYDVGLVTKAGIPPIVRDRTKRLVWEPLDLWFGNRAEARQEPGDWLLAKWEAYKFDEVILSTIHLADAAKKVLRPKGVKVHLVPHHADPRVGLDWYDPDGPIVYAGAKTFLGDERSIAAIRAAAELVGRKLVLDFDHHGWKSLEGAALVIAPRIGGRSKMNLIGKPTVKIANAGQAGIPVLATPDGAIRKLFPEVRTAALDVWSDPKALAASMSAALEDDSPIAKFPFDRWLSRMKEILG